MERVVLPSWPSGKYEQLNTSDMIGGPLPTAGEARDFLAEGTSKWRPQSSKRKCFPKMNSMSEKQGKKPSCHVGHAEVSVSSFLGMSPGSAFQDSGEYGYGCTL